MEQKSQKTKKTKRPQKKTPRRSVERKSEGARETLLEVARRLFAEKGIEGVSVRDIARAAGLNLSLVSYYFGGKEGLYVAVIEDHARNAQKALMEVLESFKDVPLDRKTFPSAIEKFIRNVLELRGKNKDISTILQRERFSGLPYARKVHEEIFEPLGRGFVDLIERAKVKKLLHPEINGNAYFICLLEAIMGYFMFNECKLKFQQGAYQLPRDKEQFVQFLTRLYTEGIYR